MSKTANIGQSDRWYREEAKQLLFDIVDEDEASIDVSGYALLWVLEELTPGGVPVDILTKASGGSGITVEDGQETNDRVVVQIDQADTEGLEPAVYRHSLWRTDTPNRALLLEGTAMLQRAAEGD